MNKLIERLLDTGRLSPVQMQELFDDIEEALEAADKMADGIYRADDFDAQIALTTYRNLTQEARDD